MKFRFTLQRESIELLNRLLRSVSKFWTAQRILFYCNTSGVILYPETITEISPTYCEITLSSPAKTALPKLEGPIECKQFFETYLIASEKPESRIIFAPMNFPEFSKAISLLSSLKVESPALFKLSQEIVNNYIKKYLVIEQKGENEFFATKIEVDLFYGNDHNPSAAIPKQLTVCLTREDCSGYVYPMCTAAKKMKDSVFRVTATKRAEDKKAQEDQKFDLEIRTESFVMMTKRGVEGQVEENFEETKAEVTLNGKTFTSLFKVMMIPGTGFIKLKDKEALELEYIPVRFPGVYAIFDSIQTDLD